MVYNLTTSFTSIIYFMYYNITCAAKIPLTKKKSITPIYQHPFTVMLTTHP